jgi:energy-coupling factor transport system ATP-binding protein
MKAIVVEDLKYEYYSRSSDEPVTALNNISFSVEEGEFVAVVGRNGSGKSTLARHLNGLLVPAGGKVVIHGQPTNAQELVWNIRSILGMVFQNPDNQLVATTVEEDVAFGPENLGVEPSEIRERVNQSLEKVNMQQYLEHSPHMLSGGQKQRVAIAGVLAMHPKCIVLDEATSMLDPQGREDVMNILLKLNREEKITIVLITHHMNEAALAHRIIVMDRGRVVLQGTPGEVFLQDQVLLQAGLDIPQVSALYLGASRAGLVEKGKLPVILEEAEDLFSKAFFMQEGRAEPEKPIESTKEAEEIIEIENLSYVYMPNSPYEHQALKEVTLKVCKGEFLGIIGHTGSGKSTLIQHFNGLLSATDGSIQVSGIIPKGKALKELRRKVGLIFQNPEDQLFEETVEKDISFGLKKSGLPEEEIKARVEHAIKITGLARELLDKSPFELSGGQKRRVAIAGVIVMQPDILVLDEPTAGLDPMGSAEIYAFLEALRRERQTTVIIVSHTMEEVARYCDRVAVMDHGRLAMLEKTRRVFSQKETLEKLGLSIPQVTELFFRLHRNNPNIRRDILTVEEGISELNRIMEGNRR